MIVIGVATSCPDGRQMKYLGILSRRAGVLVLGAGLVMLGAACGSTSSGGGTSSGSSSPSSITVAVAYPAPPQALLNQLDRKSVV